jgi:excisionase family DNA binding protein
MGRNSGRNSPAEPSTPFHVHTGYMATDAPTSAPEFLTVKETAALLRVSKRSVRRALEGGTLPAVRLAEHGSIRIPRSALEAKEKQPA